jgi:hypothetical protein
MKKQMFNRYSTTQELTEQFAGKRQGSYTILYAIRKSLPHKNGLYVHFVCQCDCGKKLTVIANEFKRLHKCPSCCQKTHNKSYTKLYKSYTCMKERCYYPHNNRYYKYGARGIKMCEEWLKDRKTFFKWAMENGYEDGLTIDRIDVNGDYCPENCRWLSRKEQMKNKTTTVWVEYDGNRMCLADWARKTGIGRCTLAARLKSGWSIEQALTTPLRRR